MRRTEKAREIGRILDEIYPEQPIPLEHRDPYTLLVAVMLSAQTTDKKVNEVTPVLFDAADTPESMAASTGRGLRSPRWVLTEVGLRMARRKGATVAMIFMPLAMR